MADRLGELLSVKNWQPAHAAGEVAYPADFSNVETPPTPPTLAGIVQEGLAYRFARIQAHDGDLVYKVKTPGEATPTYGTGHLRVPSGTYDVVQIPYGATVYVGAATGTVNGAVIWGQ